MARSSVTPLDEAGRAGMKQWLDQWKQAGPILEAERVANLRKLDDPESARIAVELLWPLARVGLGDAGEGLVPMKEALRCLSAQQ